MNCANIRHLENKLKSTSAVYNQRVFQIALVTAVVLLMLIISTALILSVRSNLSTLERLSEQSLISTAVAISSTIERLMASQDTLSNKKTKLRELLSDRTVSYVMILDNNGQVIFHSNPALEGRVVEGLDDEEALLSANMKGSKTTLQTGSTVYEFNYLLHLDDGMYLLKIVLHTLPADRIIQQAGGIWVTIVGVIALLWLAGGAFTVIMIRYVALINQAKQQEQWSTLGRMSAVIAHEIRNAIGSVKGFAQWMDEKTDLSDSRKKPLSLIIRGTSRIEELVNNLLQYSKQETYHFETVRLDELIDEAVSQSVAVHKGIIEKHLTEDLKVLVDREKLIRAIVNVLNNAVEATEAEGHIRIEANRDKGWVILTVTDNGPGFNDESIGKAFEPFYTTKSKGTGLGLAYSKKVIEAMGGDIKIANRQDISGAVVTIKLKRG